jgi:plasmid stability protein
MAKIQYTIRGVSDRLDARIREGASKEGKSLNEAVLEILKTGLGINENQVRYTDLDDLAGTWVNDPEFDRAIEEMDRVNPELWK